MRTYSVTRQWRLHKTSQLRSFEHPSTHYGEVSIEVMCGRNLLSVHSPIVLSLKLIRDHPFYTSATALLKLKITNSSPVRLQYLPFGPINIESIDSLNESGMRLEIKEWHRCKCSVVSIVEFHKSDAGSLPRRMKIDSSPAILEITKPFLFRSLRKLLAFFQLDDAAVPWALWFSEQTREPKPEDCELPEQNILAAKPNTLGNYATRMRGIPLY